ncbi:hypothetical protein AB0B31_36825 [Catellatospora citrea]|uniref:hypothetical protein n=1 Tax=Catellatospora citrea TaxID=53366 RepID=UPI0033D1E190
MEEVVARGLWMYDGIAPTAVHVVKLDYDFWYEIGAADGDLEPGEVPELNESGHLYYVRHHAGKPFWPDSQGFHTPAEAIAAAESVIPGPVEWQ